MEGIISSAAPKIWLAFTMDIVDNRNQVHQGRTETEKPCSFVAANCNMELQQEEAERQERENKAAAMAVMKRQRMLENERECIEQKPSMEIQSETKRFRQDIFKRRYRARLLNNSIHKSAAAAATTTTLRLND
ncbi:hypothetical protein ACLOJK_002418 [Asimina triloba]